MSVHHLVPAAYKAAWFGLAALVVLIAAVPVLAVGAAIVA